MSGQPVAPRQLPLDLVLRPALGRDAFVVAGANAAAAAWIDRWPDWPAAALAIWGPEGSGKSHLGAVWLERSGGRAVAPAQARDLMHDVFEGRVAAVLIDDVGAAPPTDEAGLLHLVNALAERRGSLLLLARTPPVEWRLQLPDLASRLAAAPAVPIASPDDALLKAVLVKNLADRGLEAGEEIVLFLLLRIERSFAAVRAVAERLDLAQRAAKRRLTVQFVREILGGVDDAPVVS